VLAFLFNLIEFLFARPRYWLLLIIASSWVEGSDTSTNSLFRQTFRETPCTQALRQGNYPPLISAEFPPGVVVFNSKAQNLFCYCPPLLPNRMICVIRVRPNTPESRAVARRLDTEDVENLHARLSPFFLTFLDRDWIRPILFFGTDCNPRVLAQIIVRQDPTQRITRSQSAPSILHAEIKRMPLRLCKDVCPIMMTSFYHFQTVYVLKSDIEDVESRKEVQCISAEGLRKYSKSRDNSQFQDPLRRTGEKMLSIADDYHPYILYDDEASCEQDNTPKLNTPASSSSFSTPSTDPRDQYPRKDIAVDIGNLRIEEDSSNNGSAASESPEFSVSSSRTTLIYPPFCFVLFAFIYFLSKPFAKKNDYHEMYVEFLDL